MRVRGGRRQLGFTLIEILVAIGLTAILFTFLMVPIVQSMRYFRTTTARADAQTIARNALDTMARDLSEATYVQLDMEDNGVIAFVPPLRVDPADPNSDVVTPPRPDWSHAVRFWRALNDPRSEYSQGTNLGMPNTYFLARTSVPDPFTEDDPWNPRNAAWALKQSQDAVGGINDWAPIPRVVSLEGTDWFGGGSRRNTYQPGYPYLWAWYPQRTDGNGNQLSQQQRRRDYRDAVIGLTPSSGDYDVRALSFDPLVVSGEWLTPAQGKLGADKSIYIARYPLWRLGTALTGWSALSQALPIPITQEISQVAYDPFLLIYRYSTEYNQYTLKAVCWFDRRSRSMRVTELLIDGMGNVTGGTAIKDSYDTFDYPYRSREYGVAFGVDWIQGTVRFDFPPFTKTTSAATTGTYDEPVTLEADAATSMNRPLKAVPGTTPELFEAPLANLWSSRADTSLGYFLLPDTLTVRVDASPDPNNLDQLVQDGKPERTLKRVDRVPRDYSDEYQLGEDPTYFQAGQKDTVAYGHIRLPRHLAGGEDLSPAATKKHLAPAGIWVYYRWRGNGVVKAGEKLEDEHPDLVSAYYRTASVIDIGITVARADPSRTTSTRERVTQAVHMTRRVKLRNAVREVHDAEP